MSDKDFSRLVIMPGVFPQSTTHRPGDEKIICPVNIAKPITFLPIPIFYDLWQYSGGGSAVSLGIQTGIPTSERGIPPGQCSALIQSVVTEYLLNTKYPVKITMKNGVP
jgi:hypothetical protein